MANYRTVTNLISNLKGLRPSRISADLWSTLKSFDIHYPQRKKRAGVKLQRSISTVVGKKYQSHDSRGFPEYCRGMNVNNLITVCSEDSDLPLRTIREG